MGRKESNQTKQTFTHVNCHVLIFLVALPPPPVEISNNFFNLGEAPPPHLQPPLPMQRPPLLPRGMLPRGPPPMMPVFMRGPLPPGTVLILILCAVIQFLNFFLLIFVAQFYLFVSKFMPVSRIRTCLKST